MANGHVTKLCPISPLIDLEIPGGGNAFTHEHGLSHEQCETRDALSRFSVSYGHGYYFVALPCPASSFGPLSIRVGFSRLANFLRQRPTLNSQGPYSCYHNDRPLQYLWYVWLYL